jgi:AraC family transcriptional regulator
MIKIARQLSPDVAFHTGNMFSLKLRNNSLAGIAAFYAIVNIPRELLSPAFKEIARVLQPQGVLLLSFHIGDKVLHVGSEHHLTSYFLSHQKSNRRSRRLDLPLKKSSNATRIQMSSTKAEEPISSLGEKLRQTTMPQKTNLPEVLAHARTADGVAFELSGVPKGVLEVPGLENVTICIHVAVATKLTCRRDGRRFVGTAVHGDIDIIPANTPSLWEMHDENDKALILTLPQAMLHAVAKEMGIDVARLEIRNRFQIRDPELEALSWSMKREMELGCPSGRLYMDGLTLAAASRLITQHSSHAKVPAKQREGLSGHRLKQVLSFIEDQLAEDLSIERIAAKAVQELERRKLFRKSIGVPVHQYVIQRRLERAKTFLMQDELSMAEIAETVGFAHQSHLAWRMRRVFGASPKTMKRLLAESPLLS